MLIDYQKANIYQADGTVLNDVDFQVDADQFVYVIGKVGSGKSSLLKTIYCEVDFDKDDAEKAEVLGRDLLSIKRRDIPALRREMGIIFQDFQLLHDRNVYRNLEFVLHSTGWKSSKEIAARIEQVLEAVGIAVVFSTHNHGLIEKFPGRVFKCEDGKLCNVTDKYNK